MTDGTKIAALIINWNGAEDTLDLLKSLHACQSDHISITAFVIDNGSSIADQEILQTGLMGLNRLIEIVFRANAKNIGVPAAYNQAIQIAGLAYDHYLRLDNDVILVHEGLTDMVEAIERGANEGIAIVGGNIKYFDERTKDNGGAVNIDLIVGKTRVDYPPADMICDGVLGCIMLLSGALVRRYSPEVFESSLFLCTDESELSLRAASGGMRTLYLSRLIGFHKSGRSTSTVKQVSIYYSGRNWTFHRLRYVDSGWHRLSVLTRMLMDVPRCAIRGRWSFLLGWIAGLGQTVTWFLDRRVRHGKC